MTTKSRAKSTSQQLVELSTAAPQVMAHRFARMAMSSSNPSARDRKEFSGMVAEKQIAFTQSWWTLCLEMSKAQQAMFVSMFQGPAAMSKQFAMLPNRMEKATSRAVAPIHRKAVQNAKRLSHTPLR